MAEQGKRLRDDVVYAGFRGMLAVGSLLPLALGRPIGRLLGAVALRASRRDRRRAVDNLRSAFPDADEATISDILGRWARHLGANLAEIVWLWRAQPRQLEALCRVEGLEHAWEALEGGRGLIVITGHCGNWEILNARMAVAGGPISAAAREVYDPRLDRLTTQLRERFGTRVVARGPQAGRRLVTALRRNRVIALLIDQDIRDVPGVFVPFFGRPAWTPSGAAALALRFGCPLLPAFSHRLPDNSHVAKIHPPLPIPEHGSDSERVEELTAAATAAIERQIRAHPEQWVWMHRRWRTRPEEG